jgi:hypothetical protein
VNAAPVNTNAFPLVSAIVMTLVPPTPTAAGVKTLPALTAGLPVTVSVAVSHCVVFGAGAQTW